MSRKQLPGDRVVVFLDLLGFRRAVEGIFSRGDAEAFGRLVEILEGAQQRDTLQARCAEKRALETTRRNQRADSPKLPDIELSAFSDSVVLSSNARRRGILEVLFWTGLTMLALLEEGVSSRGGAGIGPTHHEGGILVGPGLLEAYDLERRADLPRLVVSKDLAQRVRGLREHELLAPLQRGPDALDYLNVFSLVRGDPEIVEMTFARLQRVLRELIDGAAAIEDKVERKKCLRRQRWLAAELERELNHRGIARQSHVEDSG